LPDGAYAPASTVRDTEGAAPVVEFEGEDGRRRTFDFGECPLPEWHTVLAGALARRVGPGGGLRTSSSSLTTWNNLRGFLRFLAARSDAPTHPSDLHTGHVQDFRAELVGRVGVVYGGRAVDHVWRVLRLDPAAGRIDPKVLNAFRVRLSGAAPSSTPGYSDGELRRLLAAAREDVSRLRSRIDRGEDLLRAFDAEPGTLDGARLEDARELAGIARHGIPPATGSAYSRRQAVAEKLFVTRRDVPAMLVLLVAVSGRNIETIKELPAEHRVLDGVAVELRLTKRRRGPGAWAQTVTWEVGPRGRELDHPGGLYLVLHRLMARSRVAAGDPSAFWAFWRNIARKPGSTGNDHGNPFRDALTAGIDVKGWGEGHGFVDDGGQPLPVRFHRLRTSVEVRRTRGMGGHLPSAARSNTAPVLFANYLRGDPTALDWAHEVTSAALVDAERAALAAHRRQLPGGTMTVLAGPDTEHGEGQDGPWSRCRDASSYPATGKPCQLSFLDCFHCGNCVITRDHLPSLLALLDGMTQRRGQLPETEWWTRYGPTWAAIRHDVLPMFTPAELELAGQAPRPDALLDLVENPWERP